MTQPEGKVHSGTSGIRPIEASKARVRYVRFTSIVLKNPMFGRQHLRF